jgi:hypothetical protein
MRQALSQPPRTNDPRPFVQPDGDLESQGEHAVTTPEGRAEDGNCYLARAVCLGVGPVRLVRPSDERNMYGNAVLRRINRHEKIKQRCEQGGRSPAPRETADVEALAEQPTYSRRTLSCDETQLCPAE